MARASPGHKQCARGRPLPWDALHHVHRKKTRKLWGISHNSSADDALDDGRCPWEEGASGGGAGGWTEDDVGGEGVDE